MNACKANYRITQSQKFAQFSNAPLSYIFKIHSKLIERHRWVPDFKQAPGITVQMQVLETMQDSCFKGENGKQERLSFPYLMSQGPWKMKASLGAWEKSAQGAMWSDPKGIT